MFEGFRFASFPKQYMKAVTDNQRTDGVKCVIEEIKLNIRVLFYLLRDTKSVYVIGSLIDENGTLQDNVKTMSMTLQK